MYLIGQLSREPVSGSSRLKPAEFLPTPTCSSGNHLGMLPVSTVCPFENLSAKPRTADFSAISPVVAHEPKSVDRKSLYRGLLVRRRFGDAWIKRTGREGAATGHPCGGSRVFVPVVSLSCRSCRRGQGHEHGRAHPYTRRAHSEVQEQQRQVEWLRTAIGWLHSLK